MLELLLCASLTILPDYLFRRYVQGKRIGREITLFSMWYELRWGITLCLLLTVSLITLIFYYHPSTKSAAAIFRTVSVLSEINGRVSEVYVDVDSEVKAGQLLFRLDSSEQKANLRAAQTRIAEIDAEAAVAESELAQADAQVVQAQSDLQQAVDEYETYQALLKEGKATSVSIREVERRKGTVDGRKAAVTASEASRAAVKTKVTILVPAQRISAEAALAQAQVALDQTEVRAGVDGRLQQFVLRPGDVVNPLLRPAGILVPSDAGRVALIAGFDQIEADVMKVGMIAEVICPARPFQILPMVVTKVQDVIAAGQLRATEELTDVQKRAQDGTLTVYLEPLFANQENRLPPGSSCIANAYTNNHDVLEHEPTGSPKWIYLHVIDTVGLVHAMIIRMQAAIMPVTTLVLSGGH